MSRKQILPLAESILASLEPLVKMLDDNPVRLNSESTDTGHQSASSQDQGLRILLDSWLRPVHQQLHGRSPNQTGQGYAYTAFNTSEQRLKENLSRYAREGKGGTYEIDMDAAMVDSGVMRAQAYYAINETRLNVYQEQYDALRQVYKHITGLDWKWQEITTGAAAANKQINDEQAKRRAFDLNAFAQRTLIKKQATA